MNGSWTSWMAWNPQRVKLNAVTAEPGRPIPSTRA
jgi:hypothetical protein